jgi:hypothetical protein
VSLILQYGNFAIPTLSTITRATPQDAARTLKSEVGRH